MKVLILVLLLTTFTFAADTASPMHATQKDDKPIRALISSYVDAWNHHDAHASSQAFADDADISGNQGIRARGRSGIEQFHRHMFETRFKDAKLASLDVRTHFTAPHSAMVEILWEVSPAQHDPDATPPALSRGVSNWLVMGEGNEWQIMSMQNREFSRNHCVNQGFDSREFAPITCRLQRSMSWKSKRKPLFLQIGPSTGPNIGLAFPPYFVINLPARHKRWHMFRMGFRYDRTWRGYIFPTLAAKTTDQPLRY